MRNNLERATSKPKEDLKSSKVEPSKHSGELKQNGASPTPNSNNASKPSGDPKKSWVLASSTPQTKPFEEDQIEDSDEKPKEHHPKPQDDGKVYKVKDNPFVRGNTPNKSTKPTTENHIEKSITESQVVRKSADEKHRHSKQAAEQ